MWYYVGYSLFGIKLFFYGDLTFFPRDYEQNFNKVFH